MREGFENITILEEPIEAEAAAWAVEHPDCDTLLEYLDQGHHFRVFAYANNIVGNRELTKYRDQFFSGYHILKGISRYAIAGLI